MENYILAKDTPRSKKDSKIAYNGTHVWVAKSDQISEFLGSGDEFPEDTIRRLLKDGWIEKAPIEIIVGKYYKINGGDENGKIIFIENIDEYNLVSYKTIKGSISFCNWFHRNSEFAKILIPLTDAEVQELETELKRNKPIEFWANVYEEDMNGKMIYNTKGKAFDNRSINGYIRTSKFIEILG